MNTYQYTRNNIIMALIALTALLSLLTSCITVKGSTSTATELPLPTVTEAPIATQTPPDGLEDFTVDLTNIAESQAVETVAAVALSQDVPSWDAAPQHRRVTLQGYPVSSHLMKAQIFIYPAESLGDYNEYAGQVAADLKAQLNSRQPADRMPFLPVFNAAQVMHAQVKYLDFKNGSGVRFLTQFDQAPLPINSYELIYTFQGLTSDGKYYIAAVLPVTHPDLPATQQPSDVADFPAYLAQTVNWLEQQPGDSFTPTLENLDRLIQSIEVK